MGAFAGAAVTGPVMAFGDQGTADAASNAGRVFSVRDFGAPAVGGDATAAVERAVAACLKAGGGTVHFSAASYAVSKRLDVELPPGTPFALRGDGPGLSRITWTNEDGGLHIRFKPEGGFDGSKGSILVAGLSLLTAQPSGGHAVRLVCEGGSSPAPKKLVRDLILAGASAQAGWSTG